MLCEVRMKENEENIKKRLDRVFIEKMRFAVNKLPDEQRKESLLRDCIGLQARDLLKLYMELENEFHIDFNPLVLEGNFDKYDCLLEYIINEIGDKNVE